MNIGRRKKRIKHSYKNWLIVIDEKPEKKLLARASVVNMQDFMFRIHQRGGFKDVNYYGAKKMRLNNGDDLEFCKRFIIRTNDEPILRLAFLNAETTTIIKTLRNVDFKIRDGTKTLLGRFDSFPDEADVLWLECSIDSDYGKTVDSLLRLFKHALDALAGIDVFDIINEPRGKI